MKAVQLVSITETGNYLLQFAGCVNTQELDISLGRDNIPMDLLGEIYDLVENEYRPDSTRKGRGKGPSTFPDDIEVNILPIKEIWDSHDHDHDFVRDLELLEKMNLIEKGSLILPEGTYQVKIGKFITVECELHGDHELASEGLIQVYPTGMLDFITGHGVGPQDPENLLIACTLEGDADYLRCTGLITDNGGVNPEFIAAMSVRDFDY